MDRLGYDPVQMHDALSLFERVADPAGSRQEPDFQFQTGADPFPARSTEAVMPGAAHEPTAIEERPPTMISRKRS